MEIRSGSPEATADALMKSVLLVLYLQSRWQKIYRLAGARGASPGVFRRGLSELFYSSHQIIGVHCRANLDVRIEILEQRFRDRNEIAGILHVEDDESRARAVHRAEVGSLSFELLNRGLEHLADGPILERPIPLLDRNRHLHHHPHACPPLRGHV
jgi:hypothetical protein